MAVIVTIGNDVLRFFGMGNVVDDGETCDNVLVEQTPVGGGVGPHWVRSCLVIG